MDRQVQGQVRHGLGEAAEQIFATRRSSGSSPKYPAYPWPDTLPKWDSLSFVRKKLYAREAEVFAGYAAYTDYEIGRVIQAVQDLGSSTTR